MRILFAAWPGYGHLLPMVPMVRAAQRAGHEVVVSSGTDLAPLASRLGVEFRASGITAAEGYARLPTTTVGDLPSEEQTAFAGQYLFGAGAVDRAVDLIDLMETWRPDLVVHDVLELGSVVAAGAYGVPHLTHGYGPMLAENAALVAVIGDTVAAADVPDPAVDMFAAPYLDVCPPGFGGVTAYPWEDVRPLRPSPGEPAPDADLVAVLASLPYADTLYVTLGTVMNQTVEVFHRVLEGCASLPVNLVVTTGPGVDPAALGVDRPGVLCREFVPQSAVLPHCRAVVSHAGAGTMLGAVCHGLPQLCLPQGTDQPLNTEALLPTGAALALQPDQVTAEAVADAVGRLLDEQSFTEAARGLREEVERMPSADQVLGGLLAVL